jgi:hypothetical protein
MRSVGVVWGLFFWFRAIGSGLVFARVPLGVARSKKGSTPVEHRFLSVISVYAVVGARCWCAVGRAQLGREVLVCGGVFQLQGAGVQCLNESD